MRRTITLPDGRTVAHTSTKRWHVVTDGRQGLRRANSSDERSRALAWWRHWSRYGDAWLIDARDGHAERDAADNTGSIRRAP